MPCKDYQKRLALNRAWNERHRTQINAKRKEIHGRNRAYVLEHLSKHPCLDCGETDPIVLEFDHVRGEKYDNVAHLVSTRCTMDRLITEIAKCEVRCANCHRRKTGKQLGWYLK